MSNNVENVDVALLLYKRGDIRHFDIFPESTSTLATFDISSRHFRHFDIFRNHPTSPAALSWALESEPMTLTREEIEAAKRRDAADEAIEAKAATDPTYAVAYAVLTLAQTVGDVADRQADAMESIAESLKSLARQVRVSM
jgi:hypothetical protein